MAKQITDSIVRKYQIKDAYFDGNKLMAEVKDEEPIEIDLMKDLHDFFMDNEFNITVQMKTENEVEEPDNIVDIDELAPDSE